MTCPFPIRPDHVAHHLPDTPLHGHLAALFSGIASSCCRSISLCCFPSLCPFAKGRCGPWWCLQQPPLRVRHFPTVTPARPDSSKHLQTDNQTFSWNMGLSPELHADSSFGTATGTLHSAHLFPPTILNLAFSPGTQAWILCPRFSSAYLSHTRRGAASPMTLSSAGECLISGAQSS